MLRPALVTLQQQLVDGSWGDPREAPDAVLRWASTQLAVLAVACGVSLGVTWWALMPVGLYFLIHVIEGEIVTPLLIARRFTINPVAVILALLFWYWMWGVPGPILAAPMLAITKIICDRIRPLTAFGHFMEG